MDKKKTTGIISIVLGLLVILGGLLIRRVATNMTTMKQLVTYPYLTPALIIGVILILIGIFLLFKKK